MLQTNDLSMLRECAEETLTESGEIWRSGETETELGGTDSTLVKVGEISLRIAPVSRDPEEKVIAERITNATPYTLLYPMSEILQPGDLIKVGSRSFTVVGTANNRTNATLFKAVCQEIF